MIANRSRPRGTPEAVGLGFVLGVVAGTCLNGSLACTALCALAGTVVVPLVRRYLPAELTQRSRSSRTVASISGTDLQTP